MSKKYSRREFVQTTAGGIAASWGGLRILAGPQAFAQPLEPASSAEAAEQKFFVYGSEFFRPPNPPISMRREMLKAIAHEYKFNIIRIYCSWVYLNPENGRFDFSEVEEIMSQCDELGLKVLMGAVIEETPYWLEAAHPETRYVNALDQPERLEGYSINMSGGWPGLCLDWEPVREAAGTFIREMAKVVARHPSLYAYDVWNEPHIEPSGGHQFSPTTDQKLFCYCPKTIASFQNWLKKRYRTLDALNAAWVRRYPDWTTIDPPRGQGSYMDWVDWRRFMIDRSTDEMRFRVDTLRAVDKRGILESHVYTQAAILPVALSGVNPWRLAEVVETWGLSNFPRWSGAPTYLGAAQLELTRVAAGEKPFWTTELQGGHGSRGIQRSRKMRPRDIRLWNWLLVAMGGKGIIYWCYYTEATGMESTGFGLIDRDGSPSERVLEAAEDRRLIESQWDIIKDYKPKPEVAILVDLDNALLTFAMSGQEDASVDSFRGYYKALWNCDLAVDFIEPRSLNNNHYRVIIAPWHLIGKKETCEQLRQFVEAGGTLLIETGFGTYDEHMIFNPAVPPFGLTDVFGYREGEVLYMETTGNQAPKMEDLPASERIYVDGHLDFSEPLTVRVKAHTFLTPLIIGSATVIAKYESTPVAAMKKVGRGQVFYFGTNLGASIEAGDQGGMDIVRAIVTHVSRPPVTADKVRPRLLEGPNAGLLMVFNDGIDDQTARVKLPPRYTRASDLYSNETHTVQGQAIEVSVPFEGVTVLRLT